MNIKKTILILIIVTFTLTGCSNSSGSTSDITDSEVENETEEVEEIGTRSNPYHIGDTITLENIKPYLSIYDDGKFKDVFFDLTLTVDDSYTVEEGISIRESKYDVYTTIPAAKITFKLTGNYDDVMYANEIFQVSVVDGNMQTDTFIELEDDDQKSYTSIYTETEYTYNILRSYDKESSTVTVAKYYVLNYRDSEGTNRYVYISSADEETVNFSEEESSTDEEASSENTKYSAAIIAEKRGYYTIAKNLFEEILDYSDSQEHYDNISSVLLEYNGTYYGESTQYTGVNVYLYIDNGIVTAQFEGSEKSPDEYELYLYGETDKGEAIMAFSPSRTSLFSLNTDLTYGDGFAIQKLEDGSYLIIATDGSNSYSWNGIYERISDFVD